MLHPDLRLSELLRRPSSLRPVLITDAKALYDSYHRDSIAANVTDRRIALEILVVKQLMGELLGSYAGSAANDSGLMGSLR